MTEDLEKAEQSTGLKESCMNMDAVEVSEKAEITIEDTALPSFFVDVDDRIKIELDILYDKKNGTLISISRKGILDPDDFKTLGYTSEVFEFSPTDYEQMSLYRQKCSVFRREAGRALTDTIALRNFLVVWHLKDWSLKDRNGNKIELKFNKDGALTDDSIKIVYKINPTLLDVALTLYEKDMMM